VMPLYNKSQHYTFAIALSGGFTPTVAADTVNSTGNDSNDNKSARMSQQHHQAVNVVDVDKANLILCSKFSECCLNRPLHGVLPV
jgi:hypothetical protein